MLQGTWSGHTLLNLALRTLFTVAEGYLILDDTVVGKPYARLLGEGRLGVVEQAQQSGLWGLPRAVGVDGWGNSYTTRLPRVA